MAKFSSITKNRYSQNPYAKNYSASNFFAVNMINKLLGQFIEKKTFIHKIDSRLKIIFLFAFSLIILPDYDVKKLIFATLFIIFLLAIARIGMKRLYYTFRSFFLLYFFLLVMYFLFARENLFQGILTIWKFILLIYASLLLTSTTTISELVKGIEILLMPLKMLRVNPRNIALMLAATIRFIPLFFLYGERVKDAQLSRLADFRRLNQVKNYVLKVFNRMIQSASTLSDSIIARNYDVKNYNAGSYKVLKFGWRDLVAVGVLVGFITIVI